MPIGCERSSPPCKTIEIDEQALEARHNMSLSILWRNLANPGHEFARLAATEDGHELSGSAVFAQDGQPCLLEYIVNCDAGWHTRSAHLSGFVGQRSVGLDVWVDERQGWWVNGEEIAAVAGCIDIDLGFTPATNLLPIRRLGLAVGEEAELIAAWLRFPALTFEALPQRYVREARGRYRYESGGGRFVSGLDVNGDGFVTRYPDLWEVEAGRQ